MIYQNNLSVLKEKHSKIYEVIIDKDFVWDQEESFVCDAKNKEKIVVYNNDGEVFLNSKYNPTGEAEKYLDEFKDMPEKSIITMFGFANGCFAREILNITNEEVYVIAYEPSVSVFMQVINNIDITDILNNDRFVMVVNGINSQLYEVIMDVKLRTYNKTSCEHIALPKYGGLFAEQCKSFTEKTQEAYDRLQMLNNTIESHGVRICENNIINMKYIPGCRSGMDFIGAFPEDLPAIIVSAGPSLQKNKHLLKEAKGKALIMVVDTAIPHIMEMGVKPDIVVTADYMKPLKHFMSEGLQDIPFLVCADSNREVLDYVKPKDVIFCSADVQLWSNLFKRAGSRIDVMDIGGSVATAAIANAIAWKFKRIILIGQDLTFTGGSRHIGEAVEEFDFSTGHYAYVKGINGEDLITRKDYLAYLRWIENVAYKSPSVDVIDATEGGALKANTRVMSFREAIDTYCTTEVDVSEIIQNIPKLFVGDKENLVTEALVGMKKNLANLKRSLLDTSRDCHRGGMMLSRGEYNVRELKQISVSIEKTNNMLLDSDERALLTKLDAVTENEFEEDVYLVEQDDIKESIRLYEKCEKYYESIAYAIPKLVDIVDECLASFK